MYFDCEFVLVRECVGTESYFNESRMEMDIKDVYAYAIYPAEEMEIEWEYDMNFISQSNSKEELEKYQESLERTEAECDCFW